MVFCVYAVILAGLAVLSSMQISNNWHCSKDDSGKDNGRAHEKLFWKHAWIIIWQRSSLLFGILVTISICALRVPLLPPTVQGYWKLSSHFFSPLGSAKMKYLSQIKNEQLGMGEKVSNLNIIYNFSYSVAFFYNYFREFCLHEEWFLQA